MRPRLAFVVLQLCHVRGLLPRAAPRWRPATARAAVDGPLRRSAAFWGYAAPVAARYAGDRAKLWYREAVLRECLDEAECAAIWDEAHVSGAEQIRKAVDELGGFYVKVGQLVATRKDLFPRQYGKGLAGLTDFVDPLDPAVVRRAVEERVLAPIGAKWGDVFASWDNAPLGAASVAQVHRATLTAAYGGLDVAVKVQRPNVEQRLLGDIAQLKSVAKPLRTALPVDYYTVLSELERQLAGELDFVAEAAAMERVFATLNSDADTGAPVTPPVVVPRVVSALSCREVIVMSYLDGEPLSRVAARMADAAPAQKRLLGAQLLGALTDAFGRCILDDGFFHADPHPGNLLVLRDGRIGLIDFGQVKQISGMTRATLARLMIALAARTKSEGTAATPDEMARIVDLGLELGVRLAPGAPAEGPAAVAMWIFDGAREQLPGGFEQSELSPKSPATALASFPQDLVLVARAAVLVKGIAAALDVDWSLAQRWAPVGAAALDRQKRPPRDTRVRFRTIAATARAWVAGKARRAAVRVLKWVRPGLFPPPPPR